MSESAVEAELDFTQNQLPVASTPTGSPTGGESTSRRLSELPGDISQGYLTPPGSSEPQQDKRQISPRHGTAPLYPPALWKGKGRDLGDQSHQQWHLEDDPENPFQDRSAAMREPLGSSHPGHSPPQASGEGESLSLADHLAAQLADLRALPDQIRKLERQLKAAHNSLAARDRKIQELQQETAQFVLCQHPAYDLRMSDVVIL
ncbi:hypothetical protein EVJ58_g1336 [Rhodofomes roseus]|uniref:Uncharacterized protein n=1 Tax=Rhodofomes roseus TaxID=34475 RepID=A0A4Y9Z3G0_9APHY|nr:hypothetical protein EVJ58_g1336 [Rhodofomes roseus]